MKPTALLTAAALIAAAATTPAFAQAPPDGEATAQQQMQWRGMGQQRREEMAADVHTILRIRPDQEQAFRTFMASLHGPRMPPQNYATGTPPPPPTDMEAAYQSFSAVLTPDQQQVLAALRRLALDRPHWGGGHGMHRPGGMGGGQPPEGEPQ